MKTNYQIELDLVKDKLESFYKMKFTNKESEFLRNEENKNEIEQLIIKAKMDDELSQLEKRNIIYEALKLLAQNTGDTEDEEIAELILDNLFYTLKVLNQEDIDYYYQFSSTNRW